MAHSQTGAAVAQKWATAVGAWAAAIVPASTTVAAAKTVLQATLTTLFSTPHSTTELTAFASSLEAAHLTFATAVGLGMAGAGFTSTPPTGEVGFSGLLTSDPRDTSQDAADDIADALDTWMKGGLGTPIAPPNTPVVNWS
jgi:hypothetical protein